MNIVDRLKKLFVEFWEQNLEKTNINSLSFDITYDQVSFFRFCLGDEEKKRLFAGYVWYRQATQS